MQGVKGECALNKAYIKPNLGVYCLLTHARLLYSLPSTGYNSETSGAGNRDWTFCTTYWEPSSQSTGDKQHLNPQFNPNPSEPNNTQHTQPMKEIFHCEIPWSSHCVMVKSEDSRKGRVICFAAFAGLITLLQWALSQKLIYMLIQDWEFIYQRSLCLIICQASLERFDSSSRQLLAQAETRPRLDLWLWLCVVRHVRYFNYLAASSEEELWGWQEMELIL